MKPNYRKEPNESPQEGRRSRQELRLRPQGCSCSRSHTHRVHRAAGSQRQRLERVPDGARPLRRVLRLRGRRLVSERRVPQGFSFFVHRRKNSSYNEEE